MEKLHRIWIKSAVIFMVNAIFEFWGWEQFFFSRMSLPEYHTAGCHNTGYHNNNCVRVCVCVRVRVATPARDDHFNTQSHIGRWQLGTNI
jgi:hypothetical protein